MADTKPQPLKWQSGGITDGPSRAPARAMLHAVGFTPADLKRPLVGVANTWIEIGPCNYHLRDLAALVKAGIRTAGGTPMEFNTVSISDGITMGSAGMRYSVSDTAEHGDYTGGPRIITDETRKEMRKMLAEIQDGTYARNWIEEDRKGRPWFNAQREKEQNQKLEEVGARLRELMPFLKPVKHRQPAGV